MSKKLTEDQINWILSVDASDAQKEIHKLTKTNKELIKTNRERSQMLRELEAQGKKESKEYANLTVEIKKTNSAIGDNNKMMDELQKKLGLTGLTMVQLKRKAKDLQRQLDQTVQSADPEGYEALEKQLAAVRDRMTELRGAGNNVKNQMPGLEAGISKVKTAMKLFVAVKLFDYLKDVAVQAYNTRKEFAKYEATLKVATGSAKAAGKAMQMIQRLASSTPASVAEWTEAYIKLVNRGVKPTSNELTSMGDIAMSQGKSIDQFIEALLDAMTGENERLKEFGILAKKSGDKTAFTFKGVTTEVQNTDVAIKNYILSLGKLEGVHGSMAVQMNELAGLESNIGDQIDSISNKIGKKLEPLLKGFFGWLGKTLGSFSSSLDTANDKYEQQKDKVISLVRETQPLMKRYEELVSKTNKSAAEQDELKKIIEKVSKEVPNAASAVDKYGEALGLSKTKVEEYITKQKELLQVMNKTAIAEKTKERDSIQKKLDKTVGFINDGGVPVVQNQPWGMAPIVHRDSSEETLKELEAKKEQYRSDIEKYNAEIQELNGESLDSILENMKNEEQQRDSFNKMNKSQLDAWIKDEENAKNKYLEIAKEIYAARFPAAGEDKNVNVAKEALKRQDELLSQQRLELKKRYLSQNDEELQTRNQFNRAMEELTLQDLRKRLEIMGLEPNARRQIEEQILDIRTKAMEDFYLKKNELERDHVKFAQLTSEEAMSLELEMFKEECKQKGEKRKEETNTVKETLKLQTEEYRRYGEQIGGAFSNVMSSQEDVLRSFGNAMIDVAFNVLGTFINTKITELLATGVAAKGKATAEAAATPQSAVSFGAAGAVIAGILTGLISAAIASAKSSLTGLKNNGKSASTKGGVSASYTRVPGKESGGRIDVVRSQDGKSFTGASLNPMARGFISRPTVIVGDGPVGMSREWVASNAAVSNPTVSPLLNIIDHAQQAGTIRSLDLNKYMAAMNISGRADGGKVANSSAPITPPLGLEGLQNTMEQMKGYLKALSEGGIPAYTLLGEFERKQMLRNKSRKIGSK